MYKGKGADMVVSYTYNASAGYRFAKTNEVLRLRRGAEKILLRGLSQNLMQFPFKVCPFQLH